MRRALCDRGNLGEFFNVSYFFTVFGWAGSDASKSLACPGNIHWEEPEGEPVNAGPDGELGWPTKKAGSRSLPPRDGFRPEQRA